MIAANHIVDVTTDIAPSGDLVLLVGPQGTKLRVNSQCLCSASKVFSKMLSPYFLEDEAPSSLNPRDIPLPDHEVEPIRTVCCIIHHQNNDVASAMAPKDVLQIAIVADKFDLIVALKFAKAQWLKPPGSCSLLDMGYLIASAFLFRDREAFIAISLALILNYDESYLQLLSDQTICQTLPSNTFLILEERRTGMRAGVSQLLIEGKNRACSCGWGERSGKEYSLLETKYGPSKILKSPLSEIISSMKEVSTKDLQRKRHSRGIWSWYHEALGPGDTLLEKLEVAGRNASLCLDCVHGGAVTGHYSFHQHEV